MRRRYDKYLDQLRGRPCVECGRPAEPHHFIGEFGLSGTGLKAPDFFAMPLCREHHEFIHAARPGWVEKQREWMLRTLVKSFVEGLIDIEEDFR